MTEEKQAKIYGPKVEATLINEMIDQIHLREAAKEQISAIEEVAVDTYGDEAKGVKLLAEGVYKATYKPEAFQTNRDKAERLYDVVDSRKS